MLRERGLTQKTINYMISLIRHSEKGRPKGTEKRLVVARGRGGSSLQRGMWEILRVMEMFHFLTVLVTTWLCAYVKLIELCTKKGELVPQWVWLLTKCAVYCLSESPSFVLVNVTYILRWPHNSCLLLWKWPPDPLVPAERVGLGYASSRCSLTLTPPSTMDGHLPWIKTVTHYLWDFALRDIETTVQRV